LHAALFTRVCVKRGAILITVPSNGIRLEKIAGNCSRSRLRAKAFATHPRYPRRMPRREPTRQYIRGRIPRSRTEIRARIRRADHWTAAYGA